MKSLRAQLLTGIGLGTTAVLLLAGVLIHGLISRTLRAEFDEALVAKARSLAALAEQDEEGVDFELPEAAMPEFAATRGAEYYQVWIEDGPVLARSPSLGQRNLERMRSPPDSPLFRTIPLPDGRAGRLVAMTFTPRREFAQDSPIMLTVAAARDTAALAATLARVGGIMVGVGAAAIGLQAVVLLFAVRRSLKPVQRLVTQISAVAPDDLSKPIDAAGISVELLPVVERLNELLARLGEAFQRERRFTGDVAHELRTPLAGLRAKLEVSLSRDRGTAAYQTTLVDCLRVSVQMQRMVENLLGLARADAGQLEIGRERVDLGRLVEECWRPLQAKADERGLRVEWACGADGVLETDGDKLRLVIQNILDNAVVYADDGGRVRVSTQAENGTVSVVVSNTGSRLGSDQVGRVFDRFWRGDAARQGTGMHCGLGLALCKTIVDRMGGRVSARAEGAGVFAIQVDLPRLC